MKQRGRQLGTYYFHIWSNVHIWQKLNIENSLMINQWSLFGRSDYKVFNICDKLLEEIRYINRCQSIAAPCKCL